jgi:hypothetical protein
MEMVDPEPVDSVSYLSFRLRSEKRRVLNTGMV